jgi:pimeloyl-ACP methyl ester carboxylesterase
MAAHARDCVGVLDHLGVDRGVMVGHSMGAFIIARTASDFADRVAASVFIDGGLPIALPDGVEPRDAVDAVVGPALTRLSLTWSGKDELYDMWKGHPAFATWDRWHERYVDHDVEQGPDGRLHCRVNEEAVRFDGAEAILDPQASRLLAKVASPAWLLRAPRGVLDDTATPILSEQALAELHQLRPDIEIVDMAAAVNHYNIMWSDSGASVVAETLRAALAATPVQS